MYQSCWLCAKDCREAHVLVEAQWTRLHTMRSAARGGTEDMSTSLEKTIAELRTEVETELSLEKPLIKKSPAQSRHLSHFVTLRNRQRGKSVVCTNCIEEVTKMWMQLQMQIHVAVSEILGWTEWNSINESYLYDPGIRSVSITGEKKQELLRKQTFV